MLCNNKILKYCQEYNRSPEFVNTFPWRIMGVLISPEEYFFLIAPEVVCVLISPEEYCVLIPPEENCVFSFYPEEYCVFLFPLKNSLCFYFPWKILRVLFALDEFCVFISPEEFCVLISLEEFCVFYFLWRILCFDCPWRSLCFDFPWRILCFDFLWRILCVLISNKLMLRIKRINQNQIPSFKSLEHSSYYIVSPLTLKTAICPQFVPVCWISFIEEYKQILRYFRFS